MHASQAPAAMNANAGQAIAMPVRLITVHHDVFAFARF
jgi:hypothetical protein